MSIWSCQTTTLAISSWTRRLYSPAEISAQKSDSIIWRISVQDIPGSPYQVFCPRWTQKRRGYCGSFRQGQKNICHRRNYRYGRWLQNKNKRYYKSFNIVNWIIYKKWLFSFFSVVIFFLHDILENYCTTVRYCLHRKRGLFWQPLYFSKYTRPSKKFICYAYRWNAPVGLLYLFRFYRALFFACA